MTKSETRSQVHIRFPDYLIDLLDKHANALQEEARKVVPNATVSRADAVVAIVTNALTPSTKRNK